MHREAANVVCPRFFIRIPSKDRRATTHTFNQSARKRTQNEEIMKKLILIAVMLLGAMPSYALFGKSKKITVIPQTAKIYVDGNYVADGTYILKFGGKDDFFSVKLEENGYVTKEVKIFKTDTRNVISYTLKEDDSVQASVASNLANKYFTLNVREGVDEALAWKLINQVLLNYFDEMQNSDKASGYLTTAYTTHTFMSAEAKIRTRVQVKQITNEGLAYQIRIVSEIAPLQSGDYAFKPWNRVLKQYEPIINEMQQRIGAK